jgi:hypothetical protein
MNKANFYYDFSGRYSEDDEGNLVCLCHSCAERIEAGDPGAIQFASRGSEIFCEICEDEGGILALGRVIGWLEECENVG